MDNYQGRIPACGVFCGGCPNYIRQKNPCRGASENSARCGKCKSFHICCEARGISHCHECPKFPCTRFRQFRNSWLKYGQDLIENQNDLKKLGEVSFKSRFNGDKSGDNLPE